MPNEAQDGIFMPDHWLRFGDHTRVPESVIADVRDEVKDAFTPPDSKWCESVAERSLAIMKQALAELQAWQSRWLDCSTNEQPPP